MPLLRVHFKKEIFLSMETFIQKVRKRLMLPWVLIFAFIGIGLQVNAQSDCSNPIIICGNTDSYFPNGLGSNLEQLACGNVEHNSVWLAFQAKASGKLNFVIRIYNPSGLPTNSDFDWSIFKLNGPPGTNSCNQKIDMSCSYAGSSTSYGIPGATGLSTPNTGIGAFNPGIDVVMGQWYILLVDQFSNSTPLKFSVQFTNNPESNSINSTPAIFDNRPNFGVDADSSCSGVFRFYDSSFAASGISSYLWDFGDGTTSTQKDPRKEFVSNGTYFVKLTVTDNNGCKTSIVKRVVYNPSALALNIAGFQIMPSCLGSANGSIRINPTGHSTAAVSGGVPPYRYELISPSPVTRTIQTSNIFSNLPAGVYSVKVWDNCGISVVISATVPSEAISTTPSVSVSGTTIIPSCAGGSTGEALLTVSNGVPPFSCSLVSPSPILVSNVNAELYNVVSTSYYAKFSNLPPGQYSYLVTDACNRTTQGVFTVPVSSSPSIGATTTASCSDKPTGKIAVRLSVNGINNGAAFGSLQVALISPSPEIRGFQSSNVFENLYPGTYTYAIRDTCGSISTATATVSAASAPSFGSTFAIASCPNSGTGSLKTQVTSTGGGGPYLFELLPPSPLVRPAQASNFFDSLVPGNYTIRLTDGCGISKVDTVSVRAANAPTFTASSSASCVSQGNGSILIQPNSSALSPFQFELISPGAAIRPTQYSNIANSVNARFADLNIGKYTVKMTDACGVDVTDTISVPGSTNFSFPSGVTTLPSCSTSATGWLAVQAPTTGIGPYTYELIAPSPITRSAQTSRVFNNLPVGDYTIRITDACGNTVTNSSPFTLSAATAPSAPTVTNSSSCSTSSTGSIVISVTTNSGGGAPYQFALVSPSPVTRAFQNNTVFTGLPVGTYTVQTKDQCGLTVNSQTTIAAAQPFSVSTNQEIVGCSASTYLSQVTVVPQSFNNYGPIPSGSGGGPYTYAIYNSTNTTVIFPAQSTNVFPAVPHLTGSPTHVVRVTDACNITATTNISLNSTEPGVGALTIVSSSCSSKANGAIRVSSVPTVGRQPFQYSLINSTNSSVVIGPQSSTLFDSVPANASGYLLRVTDACGKTSTTTTPLAFPASVLPSVTGTPTPSCSGSSTGSILTTITNGTTQAGGTFQYALLNSSNSAVIRPNQSHPYFGNLPAGSYLIRITDNCNATLNSAAVVVSSTPTALTAAGVASVTCGSSGSGTVTASSQGGIEPVRYSLINNATSSVVAGPQLNNVFSGLAAGTYTVRALDSCGTIANSSNVVVSVTAQNPTITTTSAIDCGGFAKIAGFGAGGNGGPYTYALCSGANCSTFSSFSTNSIFTVTNSGTYRIAVKDKCGNQTISSDIVINIPVRAVLNSITKANACGSTAITVNYSNVPNTPHYSVNGSNFSPTIPILNPGTYLIRVTDFNNGTYGCSSDTGTVVVTSGLTPAITVTASPSNACPGSSITYTANATNGGSTPDYQWKLNGVNVGSNSATYVKSNSSNLDTIVCVLTSSASCVSSPTATSIPLVANYYAPITNNQITGNQSISSGSVPTQFTGTAATGGGGTLSYKWISSTTSSSSGFVAASGLNNSANYSSPALTQTTYFRRVVTGSSCGVDTSSAITVSIAGSPSVSASASLIGFTACFGSASSQQSFTVSGSNLTSNISVNPPAGYEVSLTSGSGFSSTLSLAPASGTVASTTVYIRMSSVATGTPSGNIAVASTGATTQNVPVSGTVNALPTITLGSVGSVLTNATSFSIPYSATTGTPNQYSVTAGSPTAMPGFTAVSNASLGSSPISVTIPASAANTYNFNLTVRNSTTGCVSPNVPFTLTVSAPGAISNNTIGTDQSFCSASRRDTIIGSVPTGGTGTFTYQWQVSTTSPTSGFGNPPSNTSKNLYPMSTVGDSWYRRIVTSGTFKDTSVVVKITINRVSNDSIYGPNEVCTGTTSIALRAGINTSTGVTAYSWLRSTTDSISGFSLAPGTNNQATYSPGIVNQTAWYKVVATSGSCIDTTKVFAQRPSTSPNNIIPGASGVTSPQGGPSSHVSYQRGFSIYPASEMQDILSNGDSISKVGWIVSTTGGTFTQAVTGNLKIYLVNTTDATMQRASGTANWSTIISTPTAMTLCYNGNYTLPTTAGTYFVNLQNKFAYTGQGVYLAFEWSTSSPSPGNTYLVYPFNLNLMNGTFNGTGSSSLPATLSGTILRPRVLFGKGCEIASSPTLATVITSGATSVTSNSATLGGNVTANGGASVTERGVVYSTTANPTTSAGTKVIIGSGTGSFSQNVTGLNGNTTYHVRAYATNSEGTSYGADSTFTTLTPASPLISVSGSLSAFTTCQGTASTQQSVTVSGTGLFGNITITPPSGYEVSTTSGSGFTSSVSLTRTSGSVPATTVYVRLTGASSGTPSGSITFSSPDAFDTTLSVTGTVNALPTITLGSVSSVLTNATSFSLPYSATTGTPNQYSITAGSPTAMSGFAAVSNASLGSSPISVAIPASAANTYNFNLTVRNSTTGCVSASVPFTLTVNAPSGISNNTISAAQTICSGTAPAQLTGSTPTGGNETFTYTWLKSTTNAVNGFTAIPSSNTVNYTSPALTQTTWFRRYVVSGTQSDTSAAIKITVGDTIRPVVVTRNLSVYLNASGNASITATQADSASADNCGIQNRSLSSSSFTCANLGSNTVRLLVTDLAGNKDSANFTVLVMDTVKPVVITQNRTVYLNASGNASLTASQINNGSSDACGIASVSLNTTSFTCSNVGPNTVTLTVTDVNGNVQTGTATVTVLDTIKPTVNVQSGLVLYLNANGTASVASSMINNGSTDNCGIASVTISPTTINCAHLGITPVTLTVTDVNGNSASGVSNVVVLDPVAPVARPKARLNLYLSGNGQAVINPALLDSASSDNCTLTSRVLSQSVFNCSNIGTNNVTFTVQDQSGNSHAAIVQVTVIDTIAPVATVSNQLVYLNNAGTATITAAMVNNNSTDNCGIQSVSISKSTFTCSDLGTSSINFTVTDVNGNSKTAPVVINVFDTIRPVIRPKKNVLVYLNALGAANLSLSAVDSASSDNCNMATRTLSKTQFGCADLGVNTLTLTGTDSTGNIGSAQFSLTVLDTIRPVLNTRSATLYVDGSGNAVLNPSDVILSGTDNCSATPLAGLSKSNFNCSNLGGNTVSVTLTDASGNFRTASASVTVLDTIKPNAIGQNRTIYLNASGTATITAAQVNNGSTDNCSVQSLSISKTNFTAADLGANLVTLTVADQSNNSAQTQVLITVLDTIKPIVTTQNRTIYLNASGVATIAASQINNGSTDNVSISAVQLSKTLFTCSDLGNNQVVLTVIDGSNNSQTGTATVTVVDTIKPIVNTQNITLYLNGIGQATLTPAQANNGSSDNCGVSNLNLSKTLFTCADRGNNTIQLQVTDASNNSSSGSLQVSVLDTIRPNVVVNNNLTLYLNNAGTATLTNAMVGNGSTDNCGITSQTLGKTSFNGTNLGLNLVNYTIADASGNTNSVILNITVVDTIRPVVSVQNRTIYLDGSGTATLTPSMVNNGSSDNVGITLQQLSKTSFNCNNLGANQVLYTLEDASANQMSALVTITVLDTIKPTASARNLTVYLNAAGTVSITPAQANNGSSDNCSTASLALSKSEFGCADLGPNAVVLTVNDGSNNASTASFTVTVLDTIRPSLLVNPMVMLYLDTNGQASLSTDQVNLSSFDNCSALSFSLSKTSFNGLNLGMNQVIFTATDGSSNVRTANISVNVIDTVRPRIRAKNLTLHLGNGGFVFLSPAEVDNGSTDNVGVSFSALSKTIFNCNETGTNLVEYFIQDISGNRSSTWVTVTVLDTMMPVVTSFPESVILGHCNTDFQFSIPTATDNCSQVTIKQTTGIGNGKKYPVGVTTNTFTFTDRSGNGVTRSFTVTILPPYLPDTFPNITVCSSNPPFDLTRGNANVVFSGSGVSLDGKQFDPGLSGPGNHAVVCTFTDSMGCETKANFFVTVHRSPDKPMIERMNSDVLQVTQSFDFYQWRRNYEDIPGANQRAYTMTRTGIYSVRVGTVQGCTTESDPVGVGVALGIGSMEDGLSFNLFPNPTQERFRVDVNNLRGNEGFAVQVFDGVGRLVYSAQESAFSHSVETGDWSPGTYFVHIKSGNKKAIKPVIIAK